MSDGLFVIILGSIFAAYIDKRVGIKAPPFYFMLGGLVMLFAMRCIK